ncbi:hypothetical protein G8S49_10400 [Clostridium botulinum C]|uniref:Uncharacterized protein n=2 Tax=Clostridium botulinum TaxID=1491 RepID=A0A9Q4THF7_CLOBO|nr:hypothetical protein [Clostridium botulinum]EGO88059.1 hypothetical protein CBCST_07862 [Clostridium botulinum C str. Stockholm]MCD3195621.1 hypothetical protein [Clostridium botulinum C]MCD3201036.1 hypothetical protein [Clostridium botulinum C]MCD3206445.1 hypothetical protein [Clostridium botulinum C]MCD3208997.1 hypothetical protein [Clostridium botulinum C]
MDKYNIDSNYYCNCNCNCSTSCNSYIHVYNYGNYYLRFCGTYRLCGVTHKYESKFINRCEDQLIYIPNNANCITLTVEICSCRCQWKVIMRKNYRCAFARCFIAYGSICCYCCKQVPCDAMAMIKNNLPNGVFMPAEYICNNYQDYCSYNPCDCYSNDCCNSNPSYLLSSYICS